MLILIRKTISFLVFCFAIMRTQAQPSEDYNLYLFVYESDQTHSGAGHIAIAIGYDSSNLTYYTKYRQHDGGGRKIRNLSYFDALNFDKDSLKFQDSCPALVLKLKAQTPDLYQLEKLSDYWNLNKPWSLFVNNCTDAVKRVLRATQINPGLAFLISTPNELVEDLIYHNAEKFRNEEFSVLSGDLCFYLKNERNSVPQALFGKRKRRDNRINKDCY